MFEAMGLQHRTRRRALAASMAILALTVGAACGSSNPSSSSGSGRIAVVAAENFYGNLVAQLGGRFISVTSILSDPQADPHLFEPGTANAAAVAHARLVIDNGLGYDGFMDRLFAAAPSPDRRVVSVADVLGISGAGANPHIWYDVPRLPEIARAMADGLIAVDPAHRADYERRLSEFDASLKPLEDAVASLMANHAGEPVAYTEPVAGYLLQAAGLVVRTPEAFARAIEEGHDPSPQAVAAMEGLLGSGGVRVLIYNAQATSPITDRLREIAGAHGVPIVPVTETLPPGMSFQQWQLGQVQAIAGALGG
jgi:zinc/manganese transport system substrate-binding protein